MPAAAASGRELAAERDRAQITLMRAPGETPGSGRAHARRADAAPTTQRQLPRPEWLPAA
ncbi:hypothetical protein [Streptomyces griseoluteus]